MHGDLDDWSHWAFVRHSSLYSSSCKLIPGSAGYPVASHFTQKKFSTLGGFNIGGTNASGQVRSS